MSKPLRYVKNFTLIMSFGLSAATGIVNGFSVLAGAILATGSSLFGSILYPIGDIRTRILIKEKQNANNASRGQIQSQFSSIVPIPTPHKYRSYGLSGESFCSSYVALTGFMLTSQLALSIFVITNEETHRFDTSINTDLNYVNMSLTFLTFISHVFAASNLSAYMGQLETEESGLITAASNARDADEKVTRQRLADQDNRRIQVEKERDEVQQKLVQAVAEGVNLRQDLDSEVKAHNEEKKHRVRAESNSNQLEVEVIIARRQTPSPDQRPEHFQAQVLINNPIEQKANIQPRSRNDRIGLFRTVNQLSVQSGHTRIEGYEARSLQGKKDKREPVIEFSVLRPASR